MEDTVTSNTEIRKLSSGHIYELVQILEEDNKWAKLMSEIRKDCFNLDDIALKYSFSEVSLISSASSQLRRPCAEIFLEEWGTSGKKRPTVKLLQQYLEKTDIWRAADYIAERLLNVPPSERPKHGPGRIIDLDEIIPDFGSKSDISICHKETAEVEQRTFVENVAKLEINERFKIPYETLRSATENFNERLKLGSGGFGEVYLGKIDGNELAIKVMNTVAVEHFEHELTILNQCIDHSNLLPPLAISINPSDGLLCLVYKYMPHGSLEDRLAGKIKKDSPLSWKKRISISYDIIEGLKYLHTLPKPIIHRDIKSSNILLDFDDVAKISDFGLNRVKNSTYTHSFTETIQGTSAYMAPEAMHGTVSPKSDIFCFGMLLLELLTGLPIMDDSREISHLMYHVDNIIEEDENIEKLLDAKAGEWNLEIGKELHSVADKCLRQYAKQRPNTAQVHAKLKQLNDKVNLVT